MVREPAGAAMPSGKAGKRGGALASDDLDHVLHSEFEEPAGGDRPGRAVAVDSHRRCPAARHDLTAARAHRIIRFYECQDIPILADRACRGAGPRVTTPLRRPPGRDLTPTQHTGKRCAGRGAGTGRAMAWHGSSGASSAGPGAARIECRLSLRPSPLERQRRQPWGTPGRHRPPGGCSLRKRSELAFVGVFNSRLRPPGVVVVSTVTDRARFPFLPASVAFLLRAVPAHSPRGGGVALRV